MIVRIYTGQDGQTHFEDLPLPAEESHNVAFDGGRITSDGGVMLLAQAERRLGITERLGEVIR